MFSYDVIHVVELVNWETQVKGDPEFGPEFDFEGAGISKKERGRQLVMNELINVHHNACIKINFLIKIYRPTILKLSMIKSPAQLTVSQLSEIDICIASVQKFQFRKYFEILTR